ncbi:EcsC family protein [Phormidium sp. LEGE 05292]|nr:EcsC family protein [Phormidium sp. LEGE 05292]
MNALIKLINQWLNSQDCTAKAILKNDCLQIKVESAQVPEQVYVVSVIRKGLIDLGIQFCQKVKIFGQQTGDDFPDWQEEFELNEQVDSIVITPEIVDEDQSSAAIVNVEPASQLTVKKQPSSWGGWLGAVKGAAGAVGGAAVSASKGVASATVGTAGAVGSAVVSASKGVAGAAVGTAGVVGSAAVSASKGVAGAAVGTAGVVGSAAVSASKAVAETAVGVGGAIGNAAMQAPENVGYVLDLVTNNPQLQQFTKALPQVDWLLKLLDQIDIVKAETQVRRLQEKYPHEQPNAIAHRIMLEKVIYVGGSGLATSLVPGLAAAMFAVDIAATTAIQAEMILQIACAYGFDLREPARKAEVLAVFGLSIGGSQALNLGSSYAVKAGLGFLRNIPLAGAAIGASTNAALLYALGYAACHFYEAKLTPTITMEATLETAQSESQKFLKSAISQEVIMDQILIHVYLAGNPEKTWEEMLPELKTLNLSPASLEAIAANSNSPPSLESLLAQINSDFAVPLLAQCEKIAQLDGVITPEESQVIETINKKFNINLEAITL